MTTDYDSVLSNFIENFSNWLENKISSEEVLQKIDNFILNYKNESKINNLDENIVSTSSNKRHELFKKAQEIYEKQNGISLEEINNLIPLEKQKHINKINDLFFSLMLENSNSLSSTPFIVKPISRIISDEIIDEEKILEEEGNKAQQKWLNQQKRKVKREIEMVQAELETLKKQNAIPKISISIVQRNDEIIEILEEKLEELQEQLV